MPKSNVFKKGATGGAVEFNMTPMIDCTFQLIIFFILSATVLSDALADLELHRPFESQASDNKDLNKLPNRIIVNVISDAKDKDDKDSLESSVARAYMVNGKTIEIGNRETLVEAIKDGATKAKTNGFKDFYVEVRADHRVSFGAVQGVLKAAAAGGKGIDINTKMNITALTDK
jgi:biopolymer transport protein ExbD